MSNVHVVDHPLVQHKLTLMRKMEASTNSFRSLLNELSSLMAYEVCRDMALQDIEIETPLERMNGQQIDGPTDKVMPLGDLHIKFSAFGWTVLEMNGNDMDDVIGTLDKAKTLTGQGKPILILMKTIMGKGVDFMEGHHEWHGTAPNDAQLARALEQLPETLGDY